MSPDPNSFQMQVNNTSAPEYGAWQAPKIRIRNSGQFAQDGKIEWGVTPYDHASLVSSSHRLNDVQVTVNSNRITFGPKSGRGTPFIHNMEWSSSLDLPFISRNVETFIPLPLWQNAALFFIATMPEKANATSEPFYFDVQIRWNIPEDAEPKRFRVKAIARNEKLSGANSPVFLAKIDLEAVEQE